MKEYIEREAVRLAVFNTNWRVSHDVDIAYDMIDNIPPAADVVEVRHGLWERVIPTKSAAKWSTKVSCSQCHGQGYERYNYCPHCGAKMDKEE